MITAEILRQLYIYDPETGLFTRRVGVSGHAAGEIAGTLCKDGYVRISYKRRPFQAARLAWCYVYGSMPPHTVDHINGIKNDNRIANLRLATRQENCLNKAMLPRNTSGFKGVSWNKRNKTWVASAGFNGKKIYLGSYHDINEAAEAYKNFAIANHGEFLRLA